MHSIDSKIDLRRFHSHRHIAQQMLGLLLQIPKDVVRDRISPLIDLHSLVKLDSAAISHTCRQDLIVHTFFGTQVEGEVLYKKQMMEWLASRNMMLKEMKFPEDACDADLIVASPALIKATVIDFSECNHITNEGVQHLIGKLDSLRIVRFEDCSWLADETLIALADKHPCLSEVLLKSCPLITDDAIACIAVRCEQLELLQIDDCRQLSDKSMLSLCNHGILPRISFENCPLITEEAFLSFIAQSKVPLLSVLCGHNRCITDKVMINIAHYAPQLQELCVSGCFNISELGYSAVIVACQDLRSLMTSELSADTLEILSGYISPNLQVLSLLDCPSLTDEHIQEIASCTTGLELLGISNAPLLTNRSLRSISHYWSNMRSIRISECPNLTFKGYRSLAIGCNNLETLFVAHNTNFQDNSLREFATRCGNLEQLILFNTSASDVGMEFIVAHCVNLTCINIGRTYVGKRGVERLILGCAKLKTIVYNEMWAPLVLIALAKDHNVELIVDTIDEESV